MSCCDTPSNNTVAGEIVALEKSIYETRLKINELRKNQEPQEIENYQLTALDGSKVSLKQLFGNNDEMILVHNMGSHCKYCTMWADGFISQAPYLESRCAFILENDMPAIELAEFSKSRGWNYKVVSSFETSLKEDLGIKTERGNLPALSTLFLDGDKIFRHSFSMFGPGDDFCPPWHMFELLKKGTNNWQPN